MHHHKTIQTKNILIIYEDPTLLTTDSIDPNGLTLLLGIEGGMNLSFLHRNRAVEYIISSNYMINKSIFDEIEFPADINGYGLDYFFGAQLKTNNVHITHIDNEVFHLGLDDNNKFLEKTRSALDNL